MSRQQIGESLASQLYRTEAAIDSAVREAATLVASLPTARSEAYLSAITGQRTFDSTASSLAALVQARSNMVDAHNSLSALARKLGLEALAVGPVDKPENPPTDVTGHFVSHERINP